MTERESRSAAPAAGDIIISVRNVTKSFGTQRVLDGITFDVFRGETLVIMGGSGCGKSTLLNCLIAEIPVDQGQIIYLERGGGNSADVTTANEHTLNAIRRRFGILFQSGALFNSMTLAENIALPLTAHSDVSSEIINEVVDIKLRLVYMLAHRDKMPSMLSGGQKKRAGLARATALDPELLFYDEPSAGLDPVTSTAIDELIIDLSSKLHVTSVVVTHEMDSAFRIADRMVMLDRGKVLKVGMRKEFEMLRDAPPESLTTYSDRLINQFVTGRASGPASSGDEASGYTMSLTLPQE